jgi:HAD superfamily hydrolase (TIGR01509 family)
VHKTDGGKELSGMRYQAVIFDMNGVLVDDEHVQEEAFRQVLKPLSIGLNSEDWSHYFIGRTDQEGLDLFCRAKGKSVDNTPALLRAKLEAYKRLMRANIQPVPGAVELVREASRRWPRKVGLVTSATRWEAYTIIHAFGLQNCFAVLVTSEDVDRGKPDPKPYLLAAEKLAVPPGRCLVVEDTPAGIRAAKAAGASCVAITTTHSIKALQQADKIIHRLAIGLFDEV